MDALTGGVFLAAIALDAGLSNFEFGVLAALPFAAHVVQWPVARYLLRRGHGRKDLTMWGALAGRVLLLLVAVLALLGGPLDRMILLVALGGAAVFGMASSVAWNWWMRDLVPRSELGRYFGKRLWLASLAGMLVTLTAALATDYLGGQAGWAYLVGALCGLGGLAFLAYVPHAPPMAPQAEAPVQPAPRPRFARAAAAVAAIAATLGFALPLMSVFLLRSMGLSLLAATAMAAVSQIGFLSALKGWGHLSDLHGHRPVLLIALGMLCAALLVLGLIPPERVPVVIVLIAVAHFLSGFAVGGVDLATNNLLLKIAPERGAPVFLANMGVAKAAAGALSAVAAGALWQFVGTGAVLDLSGIGIPWSLRGFQVVCLASVVIGIGALAFASRLQEPGGAPVRDVAVAMRREVRQMSSVAGLRAFLHSVSYIVEALAPRPGRTTGRRRTASSPPSGGVGPSHPSTATGPSAPPPAPPPGSPAPPPAGPAPPQ
jgi:MFS family permease